MQQYEIVDHTNTGLGYIQLIVRSTLSNVDRDILLDVEYEGADHGLPVRYSTSGTVGVVSYGTPATDADVAVYGVYLKNSDGGKGLELNDTHRLINVDYDELIKTIESYLEE